MPIEELIDYYFAFDLTQQLQRTYTGIEPAHIPVSISQVM